MSYVNLKKHIKLMVQVAYNSWQLVRWYINESRNIGSNKSLLSMIVLQRQVICTVKELFKKCALMKLRKITQRTFLIDIRTTYHLLLKFAKQINVTSYFRLIHIHFSGTLLLFEGGCYRERLWTPCTLKCTDRIYSKTFVHFGEALRLPKLKHEPQVKNLCFRTNSCQLIQSPIGY